VLGTALIAIVGGVGWAWGAHAVAGLAGRITRALAPRSTTSGSLAAAISGVAIAGAVFIALPPWIGRKVVSIPATHGALVYQAHLRQDMAKATTRLGGPARSEERRVGEKGR